MTQVKGIQFNWVTETIIQGNRAILEVVLKFITLSEVSGYTDDESSVHRIIGIL